MTVIVAYALISRRTFSFLAVVVSLTALAATSINIPPQVAAASTHTVILIGYVSAWNLTSVHNPTITVTQGDRINLQLSSGDGAPHQFFVDVDNNGIADCSGPDACSNQFPPSTTLTFTVSFAPGSYTYYCSVHPATMVGQFVVLQPPPVSGGGRPPLQE